MTDTVGFIQKLPTQLVAAFRATLEELADADVLVHLVDITHPNADEQFETVERTIEELGLSHKPRVVAFNKADLLTGGVGRGEAIDAIAADVRREHPDSVLISAGREWNLDELLRTIEAQLALVESRAPALA